MPTTDHTDMQHLLTAVTDALLADQTDVSRLISTYDVPQDQALAFVRLIERLHHNLAGVQPSKRFVRRLKQDLIVNKENNVLSRVRHLPPRVQLAAGIALVAGFMLFSRHRLINDARHESQEAVTVQ